MASSNPSTNLDPTNSNISTILLFSTTSQKLSYISVEELRQLKMRKFVHSIEIPLLAFNMDIYVGLEGERFWGTEDLPSRVLFGRVLGWWDRIWVVEGVEDV